MMIKTYNRDKRIKLTKAKHNFHIRSLTDQSFTSPKSFLQVTSITPQTTLSKNVKMLIEDEITAMLDQITKIMKDSNINLKEGMNYVRSSILFKEIDEINSSIVNQIVDQFSRNKIEDLELALQLKTKELQQLKSELKEQNQFNEQKLNIHKIPKINLTKQSENGQLLSLYKKAKNSSYQDFQNLYKQIQAGSRLQFIQISTLPAKQRRALSQFLDPSEEKKSKLMRALSPLLNNLSENDRADLLQVLKEQLSHQCTNPCCRWAENSVQLRSRMKQANIRRDVRNSSFYKSDKINEYYKRYYRSTFDIDKIKNATKTHSEEMERLYKIQKTKQKFMQKKRNARSHSTF